mmetsp:Transcript_9911/g.27070  ORF Transcript_9911/g.27070 Transcript_9911/m.27070 type:complete len:605 (-) Transcript_9911:182-1996(-)
MSSTLSGHYKRDFFEDVKRGSLGQVKGILAEYPQVRIEDIKMSDGYERRCGSNALHVASREGHLEIVKYLVESRNAEVACGNNYGATSLHLASGNGHLDVLKFLLQCKGTDPGVQTYCGEGLLHKAAENDHLGVVKYLVESWGANIELRDNYGRTPWFYAVKSGGLDLAKYLVEVCGVDVAARDCCDGIVLHDISDETRYEVAKYAARLPNIDVNATNSFGETPLHATLCLHEEHPALGILDSGRYDINAQDRRGNTLLHHLCEGASEDDSSGYGTLLRSYGADFTIKNNRGETALECIQNHTPESFTFEPFATHYQQLLIRHNQRDQARKSAQSRNFMKIPTISTNNSINKDKLRALREGHLADIIFVVGSGHAQRSIKANKVILLLAVPSIKKMIDSGIQPPPPSQSQGSSATMEKVVDAGTAPSTSTDTSITTIPLPDFHPAHVMYVLQYIYAADTSFLSVDGMTKHHSLRDLLVVANHFGCWRLKLIIEAELIYDHLTPASLTDMVQFADQHDCVMLKDACTRMKEGAENGHDHDQNGATAAAAAGGSNDDKYSNMSVMDMYRVLDGKRGNSVDLDSYMDRESLLALLRSSEADKTNVAN